MASDKYDKLVEQLLWFGLTETYLRKELRVCIPQSAFYYSDNRHQYDSLSSPLFDSQHERALENKENEAPNNSAPAQLAPQLELKTEEELAGNNSFLE